MICALKIFFDFFLSSNRERERRERTLSHLSRFIFFVARCFLPGELLEEGGTSSATRVSDDLASVEREESNVRLGASSVIRGAEERHRYRRSSVGNDFGERVERQRSNVRGRRICAMRNQRRRGSK